MRNQSKTTFRFILLSLVVLMSFITTADTANAIRKGDSILDGKAEVPRSGDIADSKYAVIAKFKPGVSERIISGINTRTSNEGYEVIVDPPSHKKGDIKITYTNIGTYKGRTLDFQIVVVDWEKAGYNGGEWMAFYPFEIGISQGGYNYISLEGTYMYHDTGRAATDLTGSYMTFNDLDLNQSVSFSNEMWNRIDKIYAYDNTWLEQWRANGEIHIGSSGSPNTHSGDERAIFTALVDGYQFDFSWSTDWHTALDSGYNYYLNKTLDWYNRESDQYFIYSAQKPVQTETLEPTKKITTGNNQRDSNTVQVGDNYEYTVYHSVPSEYNKFYYDSYTMTDTIHDALDIKRVRVYTATGTNVTNWFNISTSGNKVRAEAENRTLNSSQFYGRDYQFEIDVEVRESADLAQYITDGNRFEIGNTAKVVIDGKSNSSNTVTTTVKMPVVQAGLEKIQVYTDKADEGLPVRVYANVEDYHELYKNEDVKMKLYQDGSPIKTKTINLENLDGLTKLNVSPSELNKASHANYEIRLSTDNPKAIKIGNRAINTDGYTAVEKTFTEQDMSGGVINFTGIVMTEREQGQSMNKYVETLEIKAMSDQRVKSGYEFEVYGNVDYSNEIMQQVDNVIGIHDVTDVQMLVDRHLVGSSLAFYDEDETMLDITMLQDKNLSDTRSVVSYQTPEIFLEQKTSDSYTKQQKENGAIDGESVSGGHKLYVPIWIDDLGVYDVSFKSEQALGAHHIQFDITREIDVYAYMFSHTDSGTPINDELLVKPMPKEDIPTNW